MPNAGEVQQVGSPMDLYQNPANLFVAGFIGSPRMNFLPVIVDAVEGDGVIVSSAATGLVSMSISGASVKYGETLTLGIRPHNLAIAESGSLAGVVELVERLGSETVVSFTLSTGENWTCVLDGDVKFQRGQSIGLAVPPEQALLFDAAGRNVQAGPEAV